MTLPRRVNLVLTLRQLLKRRYAGFAVQRSATRSPKSTQKRKSPQPPSVQKIDFNFKPIPLVPESLHRQLFSADYPSTSAETVAQDETIEKLIFPDGLEGRNLLEKLEFKCAEYVQEYQDILSSIGELEELPPTPKKWNWKSGWTKYDADGTFVEVPCPDGKALFFDIEVCMNDGLLPTLAVAVSESAWFSWCSERLVNKSEIPEFARLEHLIPLDMEDGTMEKRVIIGHNVAYDRARVREQYLTKKSKTKFWDTMSMSIPMFGMADHQVALYEKKNDLEDEFEKGSGWVSAWKDRVSKNSLAAVHEKLCGGTSDLKMDKSLRDTFVKGNIEDVRHNFQALTTYCASDVKATFEIHKVMLPEFKKRMPSPITWFGMFEMGSAYLPINKNWRDFYTRCEASCAEKNNEAARKVIRASREVLKSLKKAEGYKKDPWMWAVDWNIPAKNTLPRWYQNLFDSKAIQKEDLQMIMATNVKTKSREFPRIFGLCYGPYPLLFKRDYGWGFLVPPPGADDGFLTIEAVELYSRRKEYCSMPVGKIFELILNNSNTHPDVKVGKAVSHCGPFEFHQLPHPGGAGKNVGNPFVKDYADMFKDRILWAYRHEGAMVQLLEDQSATRYWGNYRERFKEQLTVWLDDEATKGAICPTVVPAGTVTRRGVHKLFLTASNPKKGMIGTEIKSMIQCYDDKVFVGADVDSQEQWIAALLGDSASGRGRAGATPFANMLLVGSKSDNSDLHSVVAQQVGISRNNAKVLNYARLYGSGIQHAVDFLKKEGIAVKKAQELSNKLFTTTKGQQITYAELLPVAVKYFQKFLNEAETDFSEDFVVLNDRYFLPDKCPLGSNVTTEFEDWLVEWMQKKKTSISASDIIPHIYVKDKVKLFSGGFETHTFNYLEMMLRSNELRTPVLGCRLSQCLEPLPAEVADSEDFRNKYRRSIINWVVQSSAVDFLHMLLLCMHWFIEKYAIDARYSISIHDEVRYMVSEKDKYRCALALHLSNAYVRAAISQHLGIEELPMSIAFFSQVDIDKVLRKEVTIAVKNPDGQLIPEGEALDFKEVFEKTQGSLEA